MVNRISESFICHFILLTVIRTKITVKMPQVQFYETVMPSGQKEKNRPNKLWSDFEMKWWQNLDQSDRTIIKSWSVHHRFKGEHL
jgi:hypothetical protein